MNANENLVRIVLLSLLMYATLSLGAASRELRQTKTLEAELSAALKAVQAENRQLQQSLDKRLDDEQLEHLARKRLGLVIPGEKIFYYTTGREE